jgi:hypothetical protein
MLCFLGDREKPHQTDAFEMNGLVNQAVGALARAQFEREPWLRTQVEADGDTTTAPRPLGLLARAARIFSRFILREFIVVKPQEGSTRADACFRRPGLSRLAAGLTRRWGKRSGLTISGLIASNQTHEILLAKGAQSSPTA